MFWINDPSILFKKEFIQEIWPNNSRTYEQNMNAITRCILLFTLIGYLVTCSLNIVLLGLVIILILIGFYYGKKQQIGKFGEGFKNKNIDNGIQVIAKNDHSSNSENSIPLDGLIKQSFKKGNRKNPFSNVLLTQINDDPERDSAPPAFNVDVSENITTNVKKMVQMLNPDIKDTNKQLYGSLWDNFELEQSNRVFNSTPNTRVTNDQSAYAQYLYGNMPSAKEDTPEGNMQRVADNYRYTLY